LIAKAIAPWGMDVFLELDAATGRGAASFSVCNGATSKEIA